MTPAEDPLECHELSEPLRALARKGDLRRYRKGAILIEEGERGDTLFIILAGRLRAFSDGGNGRQITYGIYGPGEYLGEMSLDGGPRSASVSAVEDSRCAVVTQLTLQAHIAEHPQFAFELLSKVIRRARAATLSAKQLALNDVYGRLVCALRSQAAQGPGGTMSIEPRPTHQELASGLGCSREMVSRLLKDLERGGYVVAEPSRLVIARTLPSRW